MTPKINQVITTTNWRDIAEQQAAALASASEEIASLEADITESADVMDRRAQEARTAQRVARAVGSLRRGIAP